MLICIQQIVLLQNTVLQEKLKYHHHELIIYGWKCQKDPYKLLKHKICPAFNLLQSNEISSCNRTSQGFLWYCFNQISLFYLIGFWENIVYCTHCFKNGL